MGPPVGIRVGVDVGGTFTKAVAISSDALDLRASSVTPTTHDAEHGVSDGVASVLADLLSQLAGDRSQVELAAFSTTTAMNALLEGDVAKVGVIGIGSGPDARLARKRTSVGDIGLAPGRKLLTQHAFLDSTGGLGIAEVEAVLDRLQGSGCASLAVSGAFSVDDAAHERLVAERARLRGLPACAGHELTGTYGLETRTVSAAINASILPLVERTATIVERVLEEAGVEVPLLVLRGDGGSMSLEAFRRAPSFTIGSGPAAGVAAALHQLGLIDGLIVECGGTSSNVSIVKRGRAVLRTLRVMNRPTSIRTVDSWVVGAAGGSMARVGRRKLAETGPRSAHVAGLPYACFAAPEELSGLELELVAPRPGDPESYAIVTARPHEGRAEGGRWALTATCASVALGIDPHGAGSREAAMIAFGPLARRMKATPEQAARAMLDGAVEKIARAVSDAARTHDLGPEVPVVALGGAGAALAPEVARKLGRPLLSPEHPEVLSSIGAALSLIRTALSRTATEGPSQRLRLAAEAERACVEAGAAPNTVSVETFFEVEGNLLRAVATGAVALESGAAGRPEADEAACRAAAAEALNTPIEHISLLASTDYYRVFSGNGDGGCAVVDGIGAVPLAEHARSVLVGPRSQMLAELEEAVAQQTMSLGLAELFPRVVLVKGASIVDLSDSRSAEDLMRSARETLKGHDGEAVAIVWG